MGEIDDFKFWMRPLHGAVSSLTFFARLAMPFACCVDLLRG